MIGKLITLALFMLFILLVCAPIIETFGLWLGVIIILGIIAYVTDSE